MMEKNTETSNNKQSRQVRYDEKLILNQVNLIYNTGNRYFWGTLLSAVIAAVVGYFVGKNIMIPQDNYIAFYSLSILYLLISTPLGLKWFHNRVNELSVFEKIETKTVNYVKYTKRLFLLLGINLPLNILFYFCVQQQSHLYMACSALIFLFFCRQNKKVIRFRLDDYDYEEEEN